MNPHTRLMVTLIAALLMWAPACIASLDGTIEYWTGGLVFIGAIVFAFVGTGFISHLLTSYRQTQEMVAKARRQIEIIERRQAEDDEAEQKRRAEDQ